MSRVVVDLIEAGLEAQEREKKRFFDLADRLDQIRRMASGTRTSVRGHRLAVISEMSRSCKYRETNAAVEIIP